MFVFLVIHLPSSKIGDGAILKRICRDELNGLSSHYRQAVIRFMEDMCAALTQLQLFIYTAFQIYWSCKTFS
jgi:hypothetical protein